MNKKLEQQAQTIEDLKRGLSEAEVLRKKEREVIERRYEEDRRRNEERIY